MENSMENPDKIMENPDKIIENPDKIMENPTDVWSEAMTDIEFMESIQNAVQNFRQCNTNYSNSFSQNKNTKTVSFSSILSTDETKTIQKIRKSFSYNSDLSNLPKTFVQDIKYSYIDPNSSYMPFNGIMSNRLKKSVSHDTGLCLLGNKIDISNNPVKQNYKDFYLDYTKPVFMKHIKRVQKKYKGIRPKFKINFDKINRVKNNKVYAEM
jgi:hypothetical protein